MIASDVREPVRNEPREELEPARLVAIRARGVRVEQLGLSPGSIPEGHWGPVERGEGVGSDYL